MGMIIPVTVPEAEGEQITREKLMKDLKTIVVDAEELLRKAASDQTREWIGAVQAKAKKSLKTVNDWLSEEESAMTTKAKSAAKAAEDTIRANTWMVLGMAAMAGLAIGVLTVRHGLSAIEEGKRMVGQMKKEV